MAPLCVKTRRGGRYYRFCRDGTWDKSLLALHVQADARGEIDWNVSVDSTSPGFISRERPPGGAAWSFLRTQGARWNYKKSLGGGDEPAITP